MGFMVLRLGGITNRGRITLQVLYTKRRRKAPYSPTPVAHGTTHKAQSKQAPDRRMVGTGRDRVL